MPKPPTSDNAGSDPGAPAEESFEDFCARYRACVVRSLRRKGSSTEDADDLAQDGLLSLWLARSALKIRDLSSMIEIVTDRLRIDYWREDKTRRAYEAQFALDRELLQAAPPRAESAALQAERARLLLALRQEQPDVHRAYSLRRERGLQLSEVARIMGIDRNKASTLVRIALAKLLSAGVEGDYL